MTKPLDKLFKVCYSCIGVNEMKRKKARQKRVFRIIVQAVVQQRTHDFETIAQFDNWKYNMEMATGEPVKIISMAFVPAI